jgi:hypothetical protein
MGHADLLPTPTFLPEDMQLPVREAAPLTHAEQLALDNIAFGEIVTGLEDLDTTAPEVVADVEAMSDRKVGGKGDTKIKRER